MGLKMMANVKVNLDKAKEAAHTGQVCINSFITSTVIRNSLNPSSIYLKFNLLF